MTLVDLLAPYRTDGLAFALATRTRSSARTETARLLDTAKRLMRVGRA